MFSRFPKVPKRLSSISTIYIYRLELCNSELRLIQIAAYTNKSLAKLQNASKEVHPIKNRKYFALVFEDKILQFTPKKVHSFVHHH
jgi:hypothetical protein